MTMTAIIWIPFLIAGAGCLWWLSKKVPKGVLIVIGVLLNVLGRIMTSTFHHVYDPAGERLGSFAHQLLADLALPIQILGVVGVIHGIIILFRKRGKAPSQPPPGN